MDAKRRFSHRYRWVLAMQGLAFLLLVGLNILDEIFDLPHHVLGAPPTPVNLPEMFLETLGILLVGGGILLFTRRIFAHLRVLEGMMSVCMECGSVRLPGHADDDPKSWVPLSAYVHRATEAEVSHGICPNCSQALHKRLDESSPGGSHAGFRLRTRAEKR